MKTMKEALEAALGRQSITPQFALGAHQGGTPGSHAGTAHHGKLEVVGAPHYYRVVSFRKTPKGFRLTGEILEVIRYSGPVHKKYDSIAYIKTVAVPEYSGPKLTGMVYLQQQKTVKCLCRRGKLKLRALTVVPVNAAQLKKYDRGAEWNHVFRDSMELLLKKCKESRRRKRKAV